MGTTADDLHRGLAFVKGGHGPLTQSRCLVILEEQNEDDDVIGEEEDKRLMERRSRRWMMNQEEEEEEEDGEEGVENRSGVNSSRSSTSAECWMSTYRKLRRASELIGASAVAIDNKIEMAMDLVKNHLMFAVREEMDQMRDQIRGLTKRNKQLEEENLILRASTSPENLVRIYNSHLQPDLRSKSHPDHNKRRDNGVSSATEATNSRHDDGCGNSDTVGSDSVVNNLEMTHRWLSSQDDVHSSRRHNVTLTLAEHSRKGATLIPISGLFAGQVLAAQPAIGMAGIQLSASSTMGDFQSFHFSEPTHFVSRFDPQVPSDDSLPSPSPSSTLMAGTPSPRFLFINPEVGDQGCVDWKTTNDYNILLANHDLQDFSHD